MIKFTMFGLACLLASCGAPEGQIEAAEKTQSVLEAVWPYSVTDSGKYGERRSARNRLYSIHKGLKSCPYALDSGVLLLQLRSTAKSPEKIFRVVDYTADANNLPDTLTLEARTEAAEAIEFKLELHDFRWKEVVEVRCPGDSLYDSVQRDFAS